MFCARIKREISAILSKIGVKLNKNATLAKSDTVINIWHMIDDVSLIRAAKRSEVAFCMLFLDGDSFYGVKSNLNILLQRETDECSSRKYYQNVGSFFPNMETHYVCVFCQNKLPKRSSVIY